MRIVAHVLIVTTIATMIPMFFDDDIEHRTGTVDIHIDDDDDKCQYGRDDGDDDGDDDDDDYDDNHDDYGYDGDVMMMVTVLLTRMKMMATVMTCNLGSMPCSVYVYIFDEGDVAKAFA